MKVAAFLLLSVLIVHCAGTKLHEPPPYACGPVMDQAGIRRTFQPLIDYMELKPGDTFADVGASSGYYTVMMATLMEQTTFYIQDIDTACLNSRELNKVIDYYSRQSRRSLRETNTFHLVIGDVDSTNLPPATFDKIYTNATFHAFVSPDKIMQDLYERLKPGGALYVRDEFTSKPGTVFCHDKACGRVIVAVDDFLLIMARNNFKLEKSMPYSGYPIYKFVK